MPTSPSSPELVADCSQCFGLCCVLLPFRAADGFGVDKPGGQACGHLRTDDLCSIHDHLAESGWPGCTAYDCRGAGQQVSQVTYAGVSWRESDNLAEMSAVFSVVRVLHELLARLDAGSPLWVEVAALGEATPEDLLALDLDELEGRVSGSDARPSAPGAARGDGGPAAG